MMMKRNGTQNSRLDEKKLTIYPGILPMSSIQPHLPDLDLSRRDHQAAFWMLLNTIIHDLPGNFADELKLKPANELE